MTNDPTTNDQPDDANVAPDDEFASEQKGEAPSRARVGTGSGHSLGGTEGEAGLAGRVAGFAQRLRNAAEAARATAQEHRPAAEAAVRAAHDRAQQAMESARPHLERAAQDVTGYAREHDEQLRAAVARAARIAASTAIPPALRPMAEAVEEELHRQPEHSTAGEPPASTTSAEPAQPAPPQDDTERADG